MIIKNYSFKVKPINGLYYKLIDISKRFCSKAILVVQHDSSLSEKGNRILYEFEEFLINKKILSEWPGTILTNGKADVYYYHFSENFCNIIKNITNLLYGWKQPELPEDLCFLRNDDSVFLTNIAHEEDAFLSLYNNEYDFIRKNYLSFFNSLKAE